MGERERERESRTCIDYNVDKTDLQAPNEYVRSERIQIENMQRGRGLLSTYIIIGQFHNKINTKPTACVCDIFK